jgi:hypothetical protein
MKSLGAIQQENNEAAALAKMPRVDKAVIGWIRDSADPVDVGDIFARSLATVLEQWRDNAPNSAPTFRELMAKVAYMADVELGRA